MNNKEFLSIADPQRKHNLEIYFETHQKRGDKFWDNLIKKTIKELEFYYGEYINALEKEKNEEEEKIKKEAKEEGGKNKNENKGKNKNEDEDEDEDEGEDEDEKSIKALQEEYSAEERDRELTNDIIKNIRMEEPPDIIIKRLGEAIEKSFKKYEKRKKIQYLEETIDFTRGLIDIYLILKKAEKIF